MDLLKFSALVFLLNLGKLTSSVEGRTEMLTYVFLLLEGCAWDGKENSFVLRCFAIALKFPRLFKTHCKIHKRNFNAI